MKKSLFILSLVSGLLVQNCVSAGILPHRLNSLATNKSSKPMLKLKIQNDYVDLSGHWEGTCIEDSEEFADELDIRVSDDLSSLMINNNEITVDAISSRSIKLNLGIDETTMHFRWRQDGQALIGSLIGVLKYSNLSLGNLVSYTGKVSFVMNNGQLINEANFTFFNDGELIETTHSKCSYTKK